MTQKAPAIFIGHGSPMNAIEDNSFSQTWRSLARRFEKPRAVLCVSAHWVTEGVRVTGNAQPPTIHDFGGFPPALFAMTYPAAGAPALAADIAQRLATLGAEVDESWGLDHGAWSVLAHLYPEADVPVLQLSLDARRTPQQHYDIGRALAPLRDDGVLILGSGNIVHNLRHWRDSAVQDWVTGFDDFIEGRIEARDHQAIIDYLSHPMANVAAPDWDHFTPLLYVLGAQGANETTEVFNRSYIPGISMTSNAFGLAA
jgi:4,5-DOPA dioxygenase extradiol